MFQHSASGMMKTIKSNENNANKFSEKPNKIPGLGIQAKK